MGVGYRKSYGTQFWYVMIFVAGFVIGAAGILITFWKFTTLSGDDTVDRTILLI